MPRCTIPNNLSDDSSSSVLKELTVEEIKLSNIHEPHENDVLMGRGGKNNQHVGNEQLRTFARGRSTNYQNASKKGKSSISRELVRIVRDLQPPGRCVYQVVWAVVVQRSSQANYLLVSLIQVFAQEPRNQQMGRYELQHKSREAVMKN